MGPISGPIRARCGVARASGRGEPWAKRFEHTARCYVTSRRKGCAKLVQKLATSRLYSPNAIYTVIACAGVGVGFGCGHAGQPAIHPRNRGRFTAAKPEPRTFVFRVFFRTLTLFVPSLSPESGLVRLGRDGRST